MSKTQKKKIEKKKNTSAAVQESSHTDQFSDDFFSRLSKKKLLTLLGVFIALLVFSRFYDLGYRAYHHDESIHAIFSWRLADNDAGSYRYDPVYHGPFLYHFGALFQDWLPDTDAMARVPYALIGIVLVLVFLAWRRSFGPGACGLIAVLLALSPIINYFSRFARNDVYQMAWLAGLIVSGTLYFKTRRIRYLTLAAWLVTLTYCTKENSYVHNFILCAFVVLWGLVRVIFTRDHLARLREIFTDFQPLVRLLICFGCFSAFVFVYVALDCRLGPNENLIAGVRNLLSQTVAAAPGSGESLRGFFSATGREAIKQNYITCAWATTLLLLLFTEALCLWAGRHRWPDAIWRWLVYATFYGVLIGLGDNFIRWILAGGGSKHQFLELLVLRLCGIGAACAAIAAIFLAVSFRNQTAHRNNDRVRFLTLCGLLFQILGSVWLFLFLFSTMGNNLAAGPKAGLYDYLAYWFRHQTGEYRIWGPWWYYLPRLLLFETLPILLLILIGFYTLQEFLKNLINKPKSKDESPAQTQQTFWQPLPLALRLFCPILTLFMIGVYALLNEKVPWLSSYQALAINLWAAVCVAHWLATHPQARLRKTILACVAFVGFLFSSYQHIQTVYQKPDHSSETLVFTGTTRDFAEQIERINDLRREKQKQGKKLKISVVGEASWPTTWYFRNDEVRWGLVDLEGDVLMADRTTSNRRLFDSRRGKAWDYQQVPLRGWWFNSGVNDTQIGGLPGKRNFISYLFAFITNTKNDQRNRFPIKDRPDEKDYASRFGIQVLRYVFGRTIWSPTGSTDIIVGFRSDRDLPPAQKGEVLSNLDRPAGPLTIHSNLSAGKAGRFNEPRGLAIASDGRLAIADSKNGRVLIYNAQGQFLQSVGDDILNADYSGPCAVAFGPAGDLYVTDTWNMSVRRFDRIGNLLKTANQAMEFGRPVGMFGPRGIAIDAQQNRIYVTDTGHGRIRIFDLELNPIETWSGRGEDSGQLIEPVGITLDSSGYVYVADTGNGRIQRFDRTGRFQKQWQTVQLLPEEIVGMEPHLTFLRDGILVVSYSTLNEIWILDLLHGKVQRKTLPGADPLGIAADKSGKLWLSDRKGNRVMQVGWK